MKVVILRGIPGSGKSFVTAALRRICQENGLSFVVASADHYFLDEDGQYHFSAAKLGLVHAQCYRVFLEALANVTDVVVVDNTNTTALEIAPYELGAAAYGYSRTVYTIRPNVALSVTRNIHGCPPSVIQAMATASEEPLPDWWRELRFAHSDELVGFLLRVAAG